MALFDIANLLFCLLIISVLLVTKIIRPWMKYAAVIPKWVASIMKSEEVFINSDGETSRDFRAGDVRHSLADIRKAQNLLGYQASHKIDKGLDEAMDWYVINIS